MTLQHHGYRDMEQGSQRPFDPADMPTASRTSSQGFGMDMVQGRSVSRDQAVALIERAQRLLHDDGNGMASVHLQDALNALEGKSSPKADRETVVQSELQHRSRNIVAVTQLLVSQTPRPGASLDHARERLTERLTAMGSAVDLLLAADWEASPLTAVIRASLAHYADHRERIHCSGDHVTIGSSAVISLTLALHELETNAIKYGALSVPDGWVDLAWSIVGSETDPKLRLLWSEHGGPAVSPPQRKGFGIRLNASAISRFLCAEVSLEYAPVGVTW